MSANDFGVDRRMIEHQRIRAHAFLQREILAGVSCINRIDLCLEALAITAGV